MIAAFSTELVPPPPFLGGKRQPDEFNSAPLKYMSKYFDSRPSKVKVGYPAAKSVLGNARLSSLLSRRGCQI